MDENYIYKRKNIQEITTTIYFVISCHDYICLKEDNVKTSSLNSFKTEIIIVRENDHQYMTVKELNDSFLQKNIYIYKLKISAKEENEEIFIKLNIFNDKLTSKKTFKINRASPYKFLYSLIFEGEDIFNYRLLRNNLVNEFVDNKYNIGKAQQFLIFREYINKHEKNADVFEYLLEDTAKEINKAKDIIDYEFVLLALINILNFDNEYSNIKEDRRSLFELILSNFMNIEKFIIKKYDNNEYNKIIESIGKYRDCIKDESMLLNLDIIILWYYQVHDYNKFKKYIRKIKLNDIAVEHLIKHPLIFKDYDCSELELFYRNRNKYFTELLGLSKNFNEYIKFFCSHINDNNPRISKEDLKKCPVPDENYDLYLLKRFIEYTINNEKLYFPYEQFKQLVAKLNKNNYEKLIELKTIFEKYEKNYKSNEVLNELRNAIHETGKLFIQSNRLNNIQIITFIKEDAKYFYKDYEKKYEYVNLIRYINIKKIDRSFIEEFDALNYDYKKLMKSNYNNFVHNIIDKVDSFKDINILFSLFQVNKAKNINEEIILELIKLFNNKRLKKDLSLLEISKIIGYLLKLSKENDYYLKSIFNLMNIYFNDEDINNIYIYILNDKMFDLDKNIVDNLMKKICKNSNDLTNKSIISLLNKFANNKEMQIYFLEKQKKEIVAEKEIFSLELTENLDFILNLINNKFFGNKYKDVNFIRKTKEFMNTQREKLKNLIFSIEQLKLMYQLNKSKNINNNLKTRLLIICLGDKNISYQIYDQLINKINNYYETYEKINKIINIFSNYYPNEKKKKIISYQKDIDFINENPVSKFPNFNHNFQEDYNIANELYELKRSKIFIIIFELNKNKILNENNVNDSTYINKTKEEFNNLKKLFNPETEDEVHLELLSEIIEKLDMEEINKEIELLSDILKENLFLNKNIVEKMTLFKKKYKNIILLKKIILLLNDFEFEETKIKKLLEKSKEDLENLSNLKKLIEINEDIQKLNLDILNPKLNEKSLLVIDKMYDKPELINFFKDKTINDIHQMGEFIDDSEDVYITILDLSYLEACMKFIDSLKKYCSSEEQFLNGFFNTAIRDISIGMKFENSSSKYHDFHELYTKHLNPNEMNKEHIKAINSSSIFYLEPNYPNYKCKVKYYIKNKEIEKDFEEILDLRDIALLRKKDQNEENYFSTCDNFANVINEIQEILDLLNIISSNGYFEELMCKVMIKEGKCLCQKNYNEEKQLKEIIKELNEIKEEQHQILKDIYKKNPISRLVYGKQFEFIYKSCIKRNNKIYQKNNHLIKYITYNNDNKEVISIKMENKENNLRQMYEIANIYLNELYHNNSINLDIVYKKAFLIDKTKNGIYSHSCLLENIDNDIIRCSLNLTEHFPIAQTVLYCNSAISEEEIISFIYRSILCKSKILFIMVKPEILDIEKKKLLIQLIKELYQENPHEMNSVLLVIYNKENKNKEVIIEIEKLPNHKNFVFNDNKKYKNNEFPNVEVYSSEFSGLGKSCLIKKNFEAEFKYTPYEYIYFPINGNINRSEIINRLLLLNNSKIKIALHLDLNDSNNIELIREFLFCFLILKFYSEKENIFYYGEEIKIKIEIPNSFINFLNIFPILQFFKHVNLTKKNLPKLIISKDIKSNVQIVCNYLKYINQIEGKDIVFDQKKKSMNSIIAQPINQNECEKLIFNYINISNPNFYQINSFIQLVGEQFYLLSNSIYLNTRQLYEIKKIKKNLDRIRYFFVYSLTSITKYFITSSYENIIKEQNITYFQQKGSINLEKAKEEAINNLLKKKPFSIKSIRPSMIFINEDGQSISEIVTCEINTDEYKLLKAIYNSDLLDESRGVLDYTKLNSRQFLIEVQKVLDLKNPIDNNSSPIIYKNKQLKPIENITESYVFTSDNFIKLILISLRLRTNIPVIMMGETGCGKTSLIKIIAELKDIILYTLNIHAGIEDCDIISFIQNKGLFKDKNKSNDLVWVFFDEINTCNSLGLLTEILLKHTCKGKAIRENVKFIAACNPYRIYTQKSEIIGLYDETKHRIRNLVYNVNPLPISLLNFVFDFKTPEKEDIKRYISNILSNLLKTIIKDSKLYKNIINIALNAIYDSHEFIKNNFEISAVSLREVRRWGILFEWFYKLLKNSYFKNKIGNLDNNILLHSLNLSIYLCYYIRIYDKNLRNQFSQIMKKSFGAKFEFEEFPKKIENIIADSVDLEKGIAKNKTLLENLFAIFVCLNTRIPLFIIGKPGCSKSLSAQLIFKSMNGRDSSNQFFQSFPKLFTKSYQGSLTSNSKGILKIFQKAKKSLEDKRLQKEIISAVFFDEMGLAEISKNNPLKVIHSELEYDENKDKVAFIGISNWPLDASKMNRGIHLSITESDKEDLILTALEIAKSYDLRLGQDYKEYFTYLAFSYFEYKEKLKNIPHEFEKKINKNTVEFHGKRDFYYLIKTASKLFIKNNFPKENYEIENILNESIERNFGGLENSIKIFKQIFKKYVPNINEINEYNVTECIKNNILDPKSRYLLIVTKSSLSHYLVKLILDSLGKLYIFHYGSNFEEDTLKGYYSAKVLNKVQITLSYDNVMILKNLTSMYPSLYDLFNQNFSKRGESNYARIALGDSNTQNYYVNNNFRCIVLLDKTEIDEQDPPFINRFEKHIITFEYLLNENEVKMSKQIHQLFNGLIESDNKQMKNILKYQLLNCDLEEIQGIFYQICESIKNENKIHSNIDIEKNKNFNIYKEKIFNKIIPTFSQDIIFFSKNSNFAQKYKEEFNNIIDIYFNTQNKHKNLKSFLEEIDTNKHIIYTFSNILDYIFEINVQNRKYKDFTGNRTINIFVERINSEREVDEQISNFYSSDDKYNLCLFHYDIDDYIHLNHINYLIEAKETMLKDIDIDINSKVILFIIHLKRKTSIYDEDLKIHNEYLISHLTKWNQIFIDNLNGKDINFKKVFEASNTDLFNDINLIDLEKEFDKDLYHAFSFISYNIKINLSDISNDDYNEKVCDYIINDKQLKTQIQKIIKNKIYNMREPIIEKIFKEYNFEEKDVDFISALINYMKSLYNNIFIDTLIQFEKENILSTKLLCPPEMRNEYFNEIYERKIESLNKIENYASFSQNIKINKILGISYPYIVSIFSEINNYTNTLIEDYFENEDEYRSEQFEDIKEYYVTKNNLEYNLQKEFSKQYFNNIFNDNNDNLNIPKLQQILFKDYILFYLSKSNDSFSNKNILLFFNELFKLFISRKRDDKNENKEMEGINEENYSINNIVNFALFIETYKNYIYNLIKLICEMDLYYDDFIKDYVGIISSKIFKISNQKIFYVNNIFYNLFESAIFCIINNKNKFKLLSNEQFNDFINIIQIYLNIIVNTNIELRLALKHILYLIDFIQVKEFFYKNGINLKENLEKYWDILKKESEHYLMPIYNNTKNISNDNTIIKEEFSFLEQKISIKKEYPELISKLLNNKLKISKDINYKIEILKLLLSNNLFIIKNKTIFETLLSKYDICPITIDENKDDIEENEINDEEEDNGGFLSQLNEDKNNEIIQFLNNSDNICLDEILLSLYDSKLSIYFESIKNKEDLILNKSFEIFKNCVNYIENKKYLILNNKLGFLYCISFIKYYCFYLNKIINDEEFQGIDKKDIFSFLNDKSNFRKVIKIYILKVMNLIYLKNYNNFLNIIQDKQIFYNDFDFKENISCSLDYIFLSNENFDYYKDLRNKYLICKLENFKTNKKIIESIDDENKFLCFYDLIINEEISNLINQFKPDIYDKLSHFLLDILNKTNIPNTTKNIISVYYRINTFKEKILPSIKNISTQDYEILLYSHKFAVIASLSDKESIYSKILSFNIFEFIKNLYIPGGEPNDSLKIKSGYEIKKYLDSGAVDGVYMCSCNYWYVIDRCGRPFQKYNCKNCGKVIGGTLHKLEKRPGHIRIIRDNEENDGTKKYLSQLMKEVENERNIHFKGFKKVKFNFFIAKDKNVRNMNNITYRILSFIFYSCLYYSEKMGYINIEDLHNVYFLDGNDEINNISYILKQIWKILTEELIQRDVNNIQCFLNMIIIELKNLMIENTKNMNNNDEREEFEKNVNQIIENAILNYKQYYLIYKDNNKEIFNIKDISMKSILQETSNLSNLPEKEYPLIKYFYVTNYPSYELFINKFNSIPNLNIQYPVLTNYLNALQDESIELLQNIKNINPFVNYVLEKYSNKITREDAKKRKIRDELDNDKDMKRLFAQFKKGWNNIYKKLSNYDCHGKLPEKNITEDDYLAYCLNDNFEDNYGKYIATAYKDFITYQNNFLKNLMDINTQKEYLMPYKNQIKKEVKVQHAAPNEIISLDISDIYYNSFEDLIYSFSFRNCFKENGDINYINYKEIKFDFYSIEIELAKKLLTEKRLFANEQNQDFIIYAFEGFNQNECIILDFQKKMKKIKCLSNEEKTILSDILEKIDYKLILFNLQSLFLYFINKRNIDGEEVLIDEINLLPKNIIKIDEEIINIFKTHNFNIQLNKLIDCYEYIEFYNYDKILANVSKAINVNLTDKQRENLKNYFSTQNRLISKKDLGNAVRKFISRFLVGEKFKNIDWKICLLLREKKELWNERINSEENELQFNKEIDEIDSFNIQINQSIDFYEQLGGERAEQNQNDENKEKKSKKTKKKKGKRDLDY